MEEIKKTRGGAREGAGRKKGGKNAVKKEKSKIFQFRLSQKEFESLKSRAEKENISISAFIKKILVLDE
ncbi:hypothetical protein [Treponema pectinovorum]|uniref:hypothetical protein n=1 Tax=Treponema pectinovorum TaxID=164 RepID=UPI0011C97939|nr:hypothetical protein [Treponema pectinovorum]